MWKVPTIHNQIRIWLWFEISPPAHTHHSIINSLHPLISGRMKSVVSSGLGRHSLAKGTAGDFCLIFFNYQGLLRDKVTMRLLSILMS